MDFPLQDTAVGSFGTSYKDSLDRTLDPNLKEIRKRYTVYWDFGAAFKKEIQIANYQNAVPVKRFTIATVIAKNKHSNPIIRKNVLA